MRLEEYLITEARKATTSTEDLHEIFFALSIAGYIQGNNQLNKVDNLTDLLSFIDNVKGKLGKKKETIDVVKIHIQDEFTKKQTSILTDAYKAGIIAIKEIMDGYNIKKNDVTSVERVFGAGASGTKIVADDKVIVNLKSGNDTISVSLKYGAGQFNNLSVKMILKYLYGINIERGILKEVYKTPYGKKAIDNTLHYFISEINKIDWEDDNLKLNDNIDYASYNKKPANIRNIYKGFYENLSGSVKTTYLKSKEKINDAIDMFLDDAQSPVPSQDDYVTLLSYMVRAEPDTSYLYVAKGGAKTFFIPSQDAIRNHKIEIDIKAKERTGRAYKRDLDIKVDGNVIIQMDLNFRWSSGQFIGDYGHKGSKLEVDNYFDW
jgi:hypothetical protein